MKRLFLSVITAFSLTVTANQCPQFYNGEVSRNKSAGIDISLRLLQDKYEKIKREYTVDTRKFIEGDGLLRIFSRRQSKGTLDKTLHAIEEKENSAYLMAVESHNMVLKHLESKTDTADIENTKYVLEILEKEIRSDFPHSTFVQNSSFGKLSETLAHQLFDMAAMFPVSRYVTFKTGKGELIELDLVSQDTAARSLRESVPEREDLETIQADAKLLELSYQTMKQFKNTDAKEVAVDALVSASQEKIDFHNSSWKNISHQTRGYLVYRIISTGLIGSPFHLKTIEDAFKGLLDRSTASSRLQLKQQMTLDSELQSAQNKFEELLENAVSAEGRTFKPQALVENFLALPEVKSIRNKIAITMLSTLKSEWRAYKSTVFAEARQKNAAALSKIVKQDIRPDFSSIQVGESYRQFFEGLNKEQTAILDQIFSGRANKDA